MFFLQKKKPAFRMVFDVDSHAIRALIFELPPNGELPKVIKKKTLRLRFAGEGMRTVEKIKELLFDALRTRETLPEKVTIGLGPSIAKYRIENWIKEFQTPRLLSKKNIEDEWWTLAGEHISQKKITSVKPIIIEANGYPATFEEIVHSHIHSLLFRVIELSFSEKVGLAFESAKKGLGGLPLEFVPIGAILAECISRIHRVNDGIIVEVTDAETSLLLLQNGYLVKIEVFPFGSIHFTRCVAERRHFTREEARDTIRQVAYGMTAFADQEELKETLESACGTWKKMFLESLAAFYIDGPLSGDVVLVGEGAYINYLRTYLGSSEWLEGTSFAASSHLRVFDASAFFEGNSLGGALQGPEDVRLAALIRYSLDHVPLFKFNFLK